MQAVRLSDMHRTYSMHEGCNALTRHRFQPYFKQQWLIWGLISMVAFSILCIVSLRPIRAQAYELFFYVHLVMVM